MFLVCLLVFIDKILSHLKLIATLRHLNAYAVPFIDVTIGAASIVVKGAVLTIDKPTVAASHLCLNVTRH